MLKGMNERGKRKRGKEKRGKRTEERGKEEGKRGDRISARFSFLNFFFEHFRLLLALDCYVMKLMCWEGTNLTMPSTPITRCIASWLLRVSWEQVRKIDSREEKKRANREEIGRRREGKRERKRPDKWRNRRDVLGMRWRGFILLFLCNCILFCPFCLLLLFFLFC